MKRLDLPEAYLSPGSFIAHTDNQINHPLLFTSEPLHGYFVAVKWSARDPTKKFNNV